MSIITEVIAPPLFIRTQIAQFERAFLSFASSVPQNAPLRAQLGSLATDLVNILRALDRPGLDVSATSKLVERWDDWCSHFESISDPAFDEELEQLYIALPS